MNPMSLSFICHPAAGLQTSSHSSTVTSPSSPTPPRGLKRAHEDDEVIEIDVIDLTHECEEEETHTSKRRRVQAGPEPASRSVTPEGNLTARESRYGGAGLASANRLLPLPLPIAVQCSGYPAADREHPVWRTESALGGLPSPNLPTPVPSDTVLPPFRAFFAGDFVQYPFTGAGIGLGITVDIAPLIITHPDEM
ncbi:hypothetical protein EIP91_004604 [Steccherinum ochraceum]|uniref:Uncharacterized protein n=1 Tax=Steccherinum ochraceum TaxID=92696 RepID=A0A4R0REN6_9APHY|nr:hypothetical protein EIP91_004604 [Steccherinum ochraceum]